MRYLRKRWYLWGLALLLVGCGDPGPTCEERGGKQEFSHFTHVWVNKSLILVPNYMCKLPKEKPSK